MRYTEPSATTCEGILATLALENSSSVRPYTDAYYAGHIEDLDVVSRSFVAPYAPVLAASTCVSSPELVADAAQFSGWSPRPPIAPAPVVSKDSESLTIDPGLMETHRPYSVLIGEWWFAAAKDADGDVNFYYIGVKEADAEL